MDALGRTTQTVGRNCTRQPDGSWSEIEEYRTRSTYDIRGNLLTVKDALGRLAFRHVYDMADNPLRIDSIDAGIRRTILDAAGNEIERRDSKGALVLQGYDELNRPTRVWARDATEQSVTLREKIIYGDSTEPGAPGKPLDDNLLGKPYKHYDEAGLLLFERYDFKGNLEEKVRQVVSDSAIADGWIADWVLPIDEGCFDNFEYQTNTRYDALNRPKKITYPEEAPDPNNPDIDGHRAILVPSYNRAGALEYVELDGTPYVTLIAYNAKGQRVLIAYGNGVMTRYCYDVHTFRLVRLRTERYERPLPDSHTYRPNGGLLQDFAYDYDLVGNILQIVDRIPGCGVWENPWAYQIADLALRDQVVRGDALVRNFEYDAIYRLIYATGREDKQISKPRKWSDDPRAGFGSGNHGTPNQYNAPNLTSVYWERYDYDPAGNMLALRHGGNGASWTRHFGMGGLTPDQWNETWQNHFGADDWPDPLSNQLTHVGDNAPTTPQTHFFDANGNMTHENTSRHFTWDHADRLKEFRNQPEGSDHASVEARYLYGSDGMRIKKWVHKNGNSSESTVYIDGIFEHRLWREIGEEKQNNYLHIMDDRQRIAIVRRGNVYPGDAGPAIQYHLGDHLGSSNIVVNGDGQWINREEYFPYGETSFGSFTKKRYRFTGKERDEESGLCYHCARYYAPWLIRWVSCDPGGLLDGLHLYKYSRCNPVAYTDPTGRNSSNFDLTNFSGITIDTDLRIRLGSLSMEYDKMLRREEIQESMPWEWSPAKEGPQLLSGQKTWGYTKVCPGKCPVPKQPEEDKLGLLEIGLGALILGTFLVGFGVFMTYMALKGAVVYTSGVISGIFMTAGGTASIGTGTGQLIAEAAGQMTPAKHQQVNRAVAFATSFFSNVAAPFIGSAAALVGAAEKKPLEYAETALFVLEIHELFRYGKSFIKRLFPKTSPDVNSVVGPPYSKELPTPPQLPSGKEFPPVLELP